MTELELDALFHNAARAMGNLESIIDPCSQFETVFLVPDLMFHELVNHGDSTVRWSVEVDSSLFERNVIWDPMLYGHRVVFIETSPFDELEIIPAVVAGDGAYPVFDGNIYVLEHDGVYLTGSVNRTRDGVNTAVTVRKVFNISENYVTRNDVRKPRIPEFDASYNTDEIDKYLSEIAVSDS